MIDESPKKNGTAGQEVEENAAIVSMIDKKRDIEVIWA